MALGGGTFVTHNKVLPGAYINFVSKGRTAVNLSDRGIATIPVKLNWGPDNQVFKVEARDFITNTREIFGYSYTADEMILLREIFKNATDVYFYRLNSGKKAENDLAEAKYSGTRGNDLKVIVSNNVDNEDTFIVETILDTRSIDLQVVKSADELVDNDFIHWKKDASLITVASIPLTGGSNAKEVTGEDYQEYLDKIDGYNFNVMGCPSNDSKIIDLFAQFTKRMRDEVGAKFQTVVYDSELKHDHEGVIVLANECTTKGQLDYAGVYWLTGAEAGVNINRSLDNETYDGELQFNLDYKQSQLEELIKAGKLALHRQNDEVRVLLDINSFTSFVDLKGDDFANNQTIRVLDEKAMSTARIFNDKYNGHVPNDDAGRESFWSDMIDINTQLQQIRAIQNYNKDDLVVVKGKQKGDVVMTDYIEPVNAMRKLYAVIHVI